MKQQLCMNPSQNLVVVVDTRFCTHNLIKEDG